MQGQSVRVPPGKVSGDARKPGRGRPDCKTVAVPAVLVLGMRPQNAIHVVMLAFAKEIKVKRRDGYRGSQGVLLGK